VARDKRRTVIIFGSDCFWNMYITKSTKEGSFRNYLVRSGGKRDVTGVSRSENSLGGRIA
jgi:hypothetical protein